MDYESHALKRWTSGIVTPQRVREIYLEGSMIRIVRSAIDDSLPDCAKYMREACDLSQTPKDFRIILPKHNNPDVRIRSMMAGKDPDEVVRRLKEWQELFAQTAKEIDPIHSLQLRVTDKPHRYHAILSESEGFAGLAFHCRASIKTCSMDIPRMAPEREWTLRALTEDFDCFWDYCEPYCAGDGKKAAIDTESARTAQYLLKHFEIRPHHALKVLEYVASAFPDANGQGMVIQQLSERTKWDPSDCGKRLQQLENAGFVQKATEGGNSRRWHGRLITQTGRLVLKYLQSEASPNFS